MVNQRMVFRKRITCWVEVQIGSLPKWWVFSWCNGQVLMGTKTEIYATFVMTVVAEEDDSRSIWPSCPAFGWSTGLATCGKFYLQDLQACGWAVCLFHLITLYHRFTTSCVYVTVFFFDVLFFCHFSEKQKSVPLSFQTQLSKANLLTFRIPAMR